MERKTKRWPRNADEAKAMFIGMQIGHTTVIDTEEGNIKARDNFHRWQVRLRCDCGSEFNTMYYAAIGTVAPLHCGCRDRQRGRTHQPILVASPAYKMLYGDPAFPSEKVHRPTPAKRKPHLERYFCGVNASMPVSRSQNPSDIRLEKIWEQLPAEECCLAWRAVPLAFIAWAKQAGFSRYKVLERIDRTKPFHPLNCRWVIAE